MKNNLFDSNEKPIPPVRRDLQLIPVQNNGDDILYIHDVLGFVPDNFALRPQVEPILALLNGQFSINQISNTLKGKIDIEELLKFVRLLDENCILNSENYKISAEETEKRFEQESRRPAALAGTTYPDRTEDLNRFLNNFFLGLPTNSVSKPPKKALFAPHIDPIVGKNVYANAFSKIKNLQPKRVVILATAHYTGYYPKLYDNKPFIGTKKTFELPNGAVETDSTILEKFEATAGQTGYTVQDRAHRVEHSIELHLLFLKHIWDHDFSIVPILVNSFEELLYMPDGHLGNQIDQFAKLLRELDDEDTFFMISGDLSHVGKKFGDQLPAEDIEAAASAFDKKFLQYSVDSEPEKLLNQMKNSLDRFRICGFPPLYTFIKAFPELKGNQIDYFWWDEKERESAVSIGALSY